MKNFSIELRISWSNWVTEVFGPCLLQPFPRKPAYWQNLMTIITAIPFPTHVEKAPAFSDGFNWGLTGYQITNILKNIEKFGKFGKLGNLNKSWEKLEKSDKSWSTFQNLEIAKMFKIFALVSLGLNILRFLLVLSIIID